MASSDSGGSEGSSSGVIPVSASSTIPSESRLACERMVRDVCVDDGPGTSPSARGSAEGGGEEAGGRSGNESPEVESNTWLTATSEAIADQYEKEMREAALL